MSDTQSIPSGPPSAQPRSSRKRKFKSAIDAVTFTQRCAQAAANSKHINLADISSLLEDNSAGAEYQQLMLSLAAKELGAKWDPAKQQWYITGSMDAEPFAKWLPVAELVARGAERGAALQAILQAGSVPGERAYLGGSWIRRHIRTCSLKASIDSVEFCSIVVSK